MAVSLLDVAAAAPGPAPPLAALQAATLEATNATIAARQACTDLTQCLEDLRAATRHTTEAADNARDAALAATAAVGLWRDAQRGHVPQSAVDVVAAAATSAAAAVAATTAPAAAATSAAATDMAAALVVATVTTPPFALHEESRDHRRQLCSSK